MTMSSDTWIEDFPGLRTLPAADRQQLLTGSDVVIFPEGAQLFAPGDSADTFLLVLTGTVRVRQRSETGRDVTLYRVVGGQSCVLTTACMLAFERYSADGIAETELRAVAIPRKTFDRLVATSAVFREFVFKAYSRRITDLFQLVDDIVFQRMDVRLAARLIELAEGGEVKATHQRLATELGTAREVISRTLAEFHRRDWIEQSRGSIRFVNPAAIAMLARSGRDR